MFSFLKLKISQCLQMPGLSFRRDTASGAVTSGEVKRTEDWAQQTNHTSIICNVLIGFNTFKRFKCSWNMTPKGQMSYKGHLCPQPFP